MTLTIEAPARNTSQASQKRTRRRTPTGEPDGRIEQVSGLLDIRDKAAFIRTGGHLPGEKDARLSLAQVKELDLRPGDLLVARTRGAGGAAEVVSVDGEKPGQARPHFAAMTPVHPHDRLLLETGSAVTRLIDLLAPVGKGQRGLIVAPPKAGKTMVLKAIAEAVTRNHPDSHLMVVLVGERPEEVTDFRESVHGEVIASTFDRPERDHTLIAELAVERAKRLAERGSDVVVLLDSLTRLGRAYNVIAPNGGKTLTGGVDAQAVYLPKRLFGAARATREGGSLTILATALAETGSRMDDYFYEEFKGTGNMELRLSRALAEHRLFPAIDVAASGTRREELLLAGDEREIVWKLRRVLSGLDREQALSVLLDRLRETPSNAAFLRQVATS
ncbi:transcription termination factor Rho [Sphaerisporangium perillae]|uniref:transcription termination factor Rho n=1 Tax=Sphaerisporangium perillae TaxID=2935860 RepID=UPI00200CAB02|nr:transcription termination factor Rho [Sphaerisporangium perillae]